ncbi:MAG: hypothetical protein JWO22_1853, partial [Frankiales bacterium]|nr:hypothetical protein [Frankiales bacterium]
GPVDTVLGLLARTCGRETAAVAHLEAAVQQAAALPSPPWLADAQLHLAAAIEGSDPGRASELRVEARTSAGRRGFDALTR